MNLLIEMSAISLGGNGQQPIIDAHDSLVGLAFILPFDVGVPQFVRSELKATGIHGPLKLGAHELLVFRSRFVLRITLYIGQVMDPQINGQWYCLQATFKHLFVSFFFFVFQIRAKLMERKTNEITEIYREDFRF